MFSAICQTCRMLSSAVVAMTHGSFGFHAKSDTLLVCPPWINSSSGGPSSASSAVCSSPMRLMSQTMTRRSEPLLARMGSLKGFQSTWNTSSVWFSSEWSFSFMLRESHTATVLSADPVARWYSVDGLKLRQLTSAVCASTRCIGFCGFLVSHSRRSLSSPTEPKYDSWCRCHATSSTTSVWPWNLRRASTAAPALDEAWVTLALMSQRQTVLSSAALRRWPFLSGDQERP
mmetsp:Transcript_19170/g.73664  ORF Transcript_19170/g.73664 Transcript_19170/m.73664 type:complete len:231 (+) Transcript_19170:143-835(+)